MRDKREHKSILEPLHMSTIIAGSIFLVALLGIIMTGFSLARLYSNSLQENAINSNTTVISQINNNISYYIKDIVSISNYVQYEYRYQHGIAKDTIEDKINTIQSKRAVKTSNSLDFLILMELLSLQLSLKTHWKLHHSLN